MTGREESVPDAERRRAANAVLTGSIEEVCRHYAPSGSRVEDCWEVRGETGAVTLRVFLAGPMQGSWTDAATGARGDALDLVAHLSGLGAAGTLAEAERFLGRENAEPERKAGDAGGGQMGLFGPLPESGRRKRPSWRSGKGRKADASRRAAGADGAADGPQASPEAPAPENGRTESTPSDPAPDAGTDSGKSRPPAADPDGVSFTADDRQRIRKTAEDVAWLRSRHTVRSLDARAHERAKARKERQGRRWRRAGRELAGVLTLAAAWLMLGVAAENRYGVAELVAAYGAELPETAAVLLPDDDGG